MEVFCRSFAVLDCSMADMVHFIKHNEVPILGHGNVYDRIDEIETETR